MRGEGGGGGGEGGVQKSLESPPNSPPTTTSQFIRDSITANMVNVYSSVRVYTDFACGKYYSSYP